MTRKCGHSDTKVPQRKALDLHQLEEISKTELLCGEVYAQTDSPPPWSPKYSEYSFPLYFLLSALHAAVTGGCTEALVQPDLSRGASFTYMRWETVGVTEKKRYHFQSISVCKQPPPPQKKRRKKQRIPYRQGWLRHTNTPTEAVQVQQMWPCFLWFMWLLHS